MTRMAIFLIVISTLAGGVIFYWNTLVGLSFVLLVLAATVRWNPLFRKITARLSAVLNKESCPIQPETLVVFFLAALAISALTCGLFGHKRNHHSLHSSATEFEEFEDHGR